jgi:hypothetical protein
MHRYPQHRDHFRAAQYPSGMRWHDAPVPC